MKKLKPFITLITVVSIYLALLFAGAYIMSPGVYVNNQEYVFKNISPAIVIDRINRLKTTNPQYIVWSKDDAGEIFNPDGRREPNMNYYTSYFRLPFEDTTVIVKIFVDDTEPNTCRILFNGFTFAHDIYRGWSDPRYEKEEKRVKKVLEKEVLDKLGIKYRKLWFR